MREGFAALHTLLRRNDQRLPEQQQRQAAARAREAEAAPHAPMRTDSQIVGRAPLLQLNTVYQKLHDALASAADEGENAIVFIEREWFTEADSSNEAKRKLFSTQIDKLLTGEVCFKRN